VIGMTCHAGKRFREIPQEADSGVIETEQLLIVAR
jgi:hypothetical protein